MAARARCLREPHRLFARVVLVDVLFRVAIEEAERSTPRALPEPLDSLAKQRQSPGATAGVEHAGPGEHRQMMSFEV